MHESINLSAALRKGPRAAREFLLLDSVTAHALLNFAESSNNEERRSRAFLKAEEVIQGMDTLLTILSSADDNKEFIEKARYELQARLNRATNAVGLAMTDRQQGFLTPHIGESVGRLTIARRS